LGADIWNLSPGGYPEDGTDSKSGSFGGLVFATFSPPQRNIRHQTVPRDARQGLTPIRNAFRHFSIFNLSRRTTIQRPIFFDSNCSGSSRKRFVLCAFTRRAGFPVIQC